ncbi:DUF2442 domain-containing protein [Segnochrobactrum spirostomi]|nr:DUF2442 domain-containing protein [Segnochrobactrum spirostomi]
MTVRDRTVRDMEMPNIKAVRAGSGRTLYVTWKGGAECPVDLRAFVEHFTIFAPLRDDDDAFRAVSVGEWGWNAHWSDTLEISSDTLWRLALEQGGEWLKSWREERRLTQREAAAALGVSLRMWRYYESGEHLLPKTVRLACIGFDATSKAA